MRGTGGCIDEKNKKGKKPITIIIIIISYTSNSNFARRGRGKSPMMSFRGKLQTKEDVRTLVRSVGGRGRIRNNNQQQENINHVSLLLLLLFFLSIASKQTSESYAPQSRMREAIGEQVRNGVRFCHLPK